MNGKDRSPDRLVVPPGAAAAVVAAPGGGSAAAAASAPLDLDQRRSVFDRRSRSQPIILNRSSLQSRSKTNSCVSAIVESASSAALSSLNGLSSRPGTTQRYWQTTEAQTVCSGAEPRQGSSGLWRHLPLRARQSCPGDQVVKKPHVGQPLTLPDRCNTDGVTTASDRLLQTVPEMTFHGALTNSAEVEGDGATEVPLVVVGEKKNCSRSPSASNHLLQPARNSFSPSSVGGTRLGCRLVSGGSSFTMDDDEVSLMYARYEKIPMKDFSAEVRASVDVENFLSQAQLLLDLQESNLEHIMDCLLHHLLDQAEHPSAFAEAKKLLFTHDSVHQLAKTIQGTCRTYAAGNSFDYDQSWLCVLCTVPSVQRRSVAIARLRSPANLSRSSQEVSFVVLIVTPTKEKGTKNALETGRTFSTLFADMDLRLRLLAARTEHDFKKLLLEHMKELAEERGNHVDQKMTKELTIEMDDMSDGFTIPSDEVGGCWLGRGLRADLKRRWPHYLSDYKDGFCGHGTLHKTVSTTVFLYFACILPAIALGVLNFDNTGGYIDVKKVIYSQTIGGIFFAICGGQPMVILLTTAPLALYTKVIFSICEDWGLDFAAMFAWTGLWNSLFLLIFAFTDASKLMKWSTRSTEEIFALFMAVTFTTDAFKDVINDFRTNYFSSACNKLSMSTATTSVEDSTMLVDDASSAVNRGLADGLSGAVRRTLAITATALMTELQTAIDNSSASSSASLSSSSSSSSSSSVACAVKIEAGYATKNASSECLRENSLLYLLLMLGTLWLSISLYNFTKTPFLNGNKRTLLADCALPVSVLTMSLLGSFVFKDVKLEKFQLISGDIFIPAQLGKLQWPAILGSMFLGFSLSLLFFMDQSIAGAMVNSPENRLKKGPAYHWDLMIVALLNAALAYFGLPMVHGALPHSPLHVRAMADVEDHVNQGHVYQRIICVRETRVTGILCHVLIGLSVLSIDELKLIPRPVLDGLFLYLAITALHRNQLFERIVLLFTEQAAYPPNHYIRTVPQRKIHLFTFVQLVQLAVLCGFGFAPLPYMKMVFPVLLLLLLPVRHKLVPFLVERKFLHCLDGQQ